MKDYEPNDFRNSVYDNARRLARRYPKEMLELVVDRNIHHRLQNDIARGVLGGGFDEQGLVNWFIWLPVVVLETRTLGGYWEVRVKHEENAKSWDIPCPNCGEIIRFEKEDRSY